ncbi:MAG: hypothetical protein A3E01_14670 [Gammaproteobacteria bacterium RIFCSPHIGHO2_12_FULL_63_22]|nr:MAG: hypothetical protein A3E01_14670 [Gammaproteobacteria bacterium RIFCSPHIGHO2_12_FULL_63_22]
MGLFSSDVASRTKRQGRFALVAFSLVAAAAQAQTISTISGNGNDAWTGDGGPATSASHATPLGLARDSAGNIYVSEIGSNRIRRIAPNGTITTFAGNGLETTTGNSWETNIGDGGPATAAPMGPTQLAVDAAGNLYVADIAHDRVRKITPAGIISTFAGVGLPGFTGDGGLATSARLHEVHGLATDSAGNVYISTGARIRKVNAAGIISTIAGTGIPGYAGDGGPATSATVHTPAGAAADGAGNVYFADSGNETVRKISSAGTISTIIGGGTFFDDLLATKLSLLSPTDVAVDSKGYVYVALEGSNAVRKVSPTGAIGNAGGYFCPYFALCPYGSYNGDGGNALQATLNGPTAIDLDAADNLYIADTGNSRIRRVTPTAPVPDPIGRDALAPRTKTAIDSFPEAVAIGDVTGDGRNDIVVATREWISFDPRPDDFKVFLYVQLPDGTLAAPVKAPMGTINATHVGLVLTDLNHDGRKDIVLGHGEGFLVFPGNAAGTLTSTLVPMPNDHAYLYYSSIIAMDVNRDGHVDIVEAGTNPSTLQYGLWTHMGNGALGFAAPVFMETPGWFRRHIVAGDLDSDGNLDLVTLGGNANLGIEVFFHDGVSGFQRGRPLLGYPAPISSGLATGDINDDGRTDVTLARPTNSPTWVYLFMQDTNNKLDGGIPLPTYDIPSQVKMGDMNGDGRTDLLVLHDGWGAVSYYQRLATGFAPAMKFELPTQTNRYENTGSFAVGDVNNDGCLDVVVADETDDLVVMRGQHCNTSATVSDFDGDRKSDLLWLDANSAGQVWPAASNPESTPIAAAAGWSVAAIGDFGGDGDSDLFWRNCVNGANRIWNGGRESQTRAAASMSDKAWRITTSGDFDGDGASDLLWRHASGRTLLWPSADARRQRRMATLVPGWSVVAVGDFDGDGRDDVFWRHGATGANLIWRAGGLGGASRATAILDRAWQVMGAGDFDGDGKADLLWRNARTGANAVWRSANFSTRLSLRGVTDPAWSVAAVGDFDGDRRFDIAWHHATRGTNVVWKRADPDNTLPIASTPASWKAANLANACSGPSQAARSAARFEARRGGL